MKTSRGAAGWIEDEPRTWTRAERKAIKAHMRDPWGLRPTASLPRWAGIAIFAGCLATILAGALIGDLR